MPGDLVRRANVPAELHLIAPIPDRTGKVTRKLVHDAGRVDWSLVAKPAAIGDSGAVPVPFVEVIFEAGDGSGWVELVPLGNVRCIRVPMRRVQIHEPAPDPLVVVKG